MKRQLDIILHTDLEVLDIIRNEDIFRDVSSIDDLDFSEEVGMIDLIQKNPVVNENMTISFEIKDISFAIGEMVSKKVLLNNYKKYGLLPETLNKISESDIKKYPVYITPSGRKYLFSSKHNVKIFKSQDEMIDALVEFVTKYQELNDSMVLEEITKKYQKKRN